jgi:hypothetical protein
VNQVPFRDIVKKIKSKYENKELLSAILYRLKKPVRYIYRMNSYRKTYKHYTAILQTKKEKVNSGMKISIAFFVMYDSSFPSQPLYEAMLKNDIFTPFIVVIPDIARGNENMFYQMEKTYNSLSKKFGNIYKSYDEKLKLFIDFSDKMDLMCSENPYDTMTYKYYSIEYLKNKDILLFYINYFYAGRTKYEYSVVQLPSYNYMWKIFFESEKSMEILGKKQPVKGKNFVLSGYCKMDELAEQKLSPRNRKKIIIAPHHTVRQTKVINLSQFLQYSNFFIELPKIYSDIDFVFRPHPLLFVTLKNTDLWGKEKTEQYLESLLSSPNISYSEGGDYFDLFINSDAMIHDCGSFLAEYLYTDHPQCYLLKNENEIGQEFTSFGKEILEHVYKSFSKQDILNFIDTVVIKENDSMGKYRKDYANKYIKINYPNASQRIIQYLKEELT